MPRRAPSNTPVLYAELSVDLDSMPSVRLAWVAGSDVHSMVSSKLAPTFGTLYKEAELLPSADPVRGCRGLFIRLKGRINPRQV